MQIYPDDPLISPIAPETSQNTEIIPSPIRDYFLIAKKYFPQKYTFLHQDNFCPFMELATNQTLTSKQCQTLTQDFKKQGFFNTAETPADPRPELPLLETKEVQEFNFVDTSLVEYQGKAFERTAECAAQGEITHHQIPHLEESGRFYSAEGFLYTSLTITHMYCASILREPESNQTILTGEIYRKGEMQGITAGLQFHPKLTNLDDVEYSALRVVPADMTYWMD